MIYFLYHFILCTRHFQEIYKTCSRRLKPAATKINWLYILNINCSVQSILYSCVFLIFILFLNKLFSKLIYNYNINKIFIYTSFNHMLANKKIRVVLGISGGVDSAVAALLLLEQGYDVAAVFMQNWKPENDDPFCSAEQDLTDARAICDHLKIPLSTVNFSNEYWNKVFQYLLDEYAAGRTPNPDIMCNKEIKFKAFLEHAKELKADFIATGHYARCISNCRGDPSGRPQRYHLLKGKDTNKDQSYFLHQLNQEQLKYSLFPVGELTKTEVREIAKKAGLINHAKKDSTGICFIGERKFKKFLSEYLLAKPGEIYSIDNSVGADPCVRPSIKTQDGICVGRHDGLMFYTLGQRQGLNIGGQKNAKEAPWYVVQKDLVNNRLIVSQEHDHPLLLSKTIYSEPIHWIAGEAPKLPFNCNAKIRYRQNDQQCVIIDYDKIEFAESQWAATPGQSIVFYKDDECLGGGIIK